jgi:UDP-4-amino-4,6-dideoxy-N-acetyl-beta-L-altrosamine N-acetyltransferase
MIELRDVSSGDEEQLYRWRREPDVARWMSDAAFPSAWDHQRWFAGLVSDPDRIGWMIDLSGQPAGFLTLTGLTSHHRRAAWNWFVGSADARGRGVGRAAQVLGLEKAFSTLKLHKVWSEVMADNDAALRVQTQAGFRREGYLRGHVLKGGMARDIVLLGLLSEEWRVLRRKAISTLVTGGLIASHWADDF